SHSPCRGDGSLTHGFAAFLGHAGGWGLFDDFLMTALNRAVALEEMDIIALGVGKYLYFDVAGLLQIAFDKYAIVAETAGSFTFARCQGFGEFSTGFDDAHAFATTPSAGLDQYGVADGISLLAQEGRVLIVAMVAGHQRDAGFFHQCLCGGLAAHGGNGAGWRTDENNACISTSLGKEIGRASCRERVEFSVGATSRTDQNLKESNDND